METGTGACIKGLLSHSIFTASLTFWYRNSETHRNTKDGVRKMQAVKRSKRTRHIRRRSRRIKRFGTHTLEQPSANSGLTGPPEHSRNISINFPAAATMSQQVPITCSSTVFQILHEKPASSSASSSRAPASINIRVNSAKPLSAAAATGLGSHQGARHGVKRKASCCCVFIPETPLFTPPAYADRTHPSDGCTPAIGLEHCKL